MWFVSGRFVGDRGIVTVSIIDIVDVALGLAVSLTTDLGLGAATRTLGELAL